MLNLKHNVNEFESSMVSVDIDHKKLVFEILIVAFVFLFCFNQNHTINNTLYTLKILSDVFIDYYYEFCVFILI